MFQEIFSPGFLNQKVTIQQRTSVQGAFGPESAVWEDMFDGPRWAAITSTPPGIGSTRVNKTFSEHRRKKAAGMYLVFRSSIAFAARLRTGVEDVRYVDNRTGIIYKQVNVDWTPGAYPVHFLIIPVVIAPEEPD